MTDRAEAILDAALDFLPSPDAGCVERIESAVAQYRRDEPEYANSPRLNDVCRKLEEFARLSDRLAELHDESLGWLHTATDGALPPAAALANYSRSCEETRRRIVEQHRPERGGRKPAWILNGWSSPHERLIAELIDIGAEAGLALSPSETTDLVGFVERGCELAGCKFSLRLFKSNITYPKPGRLCARSQNFERIF